MISALFHDGVVVTESDNDRAFYGEIYHRLSEQTKGLPSLLFVNAQNKQTIPDILGPLRSFGVPAVGITDIDVIKGGGQEWIKWLKAAQIPDALHIGLGQTRASVFGKFQQAAVDMKTQGGVAALPNTVDRQAANDLFDNLEQYGVFVTRKGELEQWLHPLNVPGKKTDWTIAMLEKLGDDPTKPNYVKPAQSDVWDFLRGIVAWIRNPARKGTP